MSVNNVFWSVQQDLYLIYRVHKETPFIWRSINNDRNLVLRSDATCQSRYKLIIKSSEYMQQLVTQSDWKLSEDLKLEKAALEKKRNWEIISTELGREGEICEKRWCLLQAVRVHHADLLVPRKEGSYYDITDPAEAPPVTHPPEPEQPPKVSHKRTATEKQPQRKKYEFDLFEPLV